MIHPNGITAANTYYTKQEEISGAQRRLRSLTLFITLLFAILLVRFWFLQIAKGDYYRRRSDENRTAVIELPAPRGMIRDRRGEILAATRPAYSISILPAEVVNLDALLNRLSQILGRPVEELKSIYHDNRIGRFKPVPIARDVSLQAVTSVEEEQSYLPGVLVESDPIRIYPQGQFASHLIGYTREVSAEELARLSDADYRIQLAHELGAKMPHAEYLRLCNENYRPRDVVGKVGVERFADLFLRGDLGKQRVERDAHGNLLKILGSVSPSPGNTVNLTLDARVQRAAEAGLKGKVGAAVALDPRNGDVIAMASAPAFDPTWYTQRMDPAQYRQRIGDNPHHPMINRAISSTYPPGSTFKIISATALLENGIITPRSGSYCGGGMRIGRFFKRCWSRHGSVNIISALAKSCDVFFYQYGRILCGNSPDPLAKWAEKFGMGQKTGIAIPGERAGHIPTLEEHRRINDRSWYPGDSANIIIGQGSILVSPLQVARMASVIANGGTVYQPRVVRDITDVKGRVCATFPIKVVQRASIRPDVLNTVRSGLREAVTNGTAGVVRMEQVAVAGKTGSAENNPRKRAHAWFCCFAPYDKPTIAIAVLVEEGAHGATAAGPIARDMIKAYFGIKDGASAPQVRGD